jgi:hypothetical protein
VIAEALRADLAERFERFTEPEPNSGCLLWIGAWNSATEESYGRINVNGEIRYAHHVAYELAHGDIPDGLWVLHRCDVRPCVLDAHLFAGTDGDNVRDMVAKGRHFSPMREVTHCPKGHSYDEANTGRGIKGARTCRACARQRKRIANGVTGDALNAPPITPIEIARRGAAARWRKTPPCC